MRIMIVMIMIMLIAIFNRTRCAGPGHHKYMFGGVAGVIVMMF